MICISSPSLEVARPDASRRVMTMWLGTMYFLLHTISLAAEPNDSKFGPSFQARFADGRSEPVHFVASSDRQRLLLSNSKALTDVVRLDRPSRIQDALCTTPLSVVEFANGDRLTGAILRADEKQLELQRPNNGSLMRLDVGTLAQIELTPGMSTLAGDEDIAATSNPWRDTNHKPLARRVDSALGPVSQLDRAARMRWDQPLSRGQVVVWLSVPATAQEALSVSFNFGSNAPRCELELRRAEPGNELLVTARSAPTSAARAPVKLALREARFCLRALLQGDQFLVAINRDVVSQGALSQGLLELNLQRSPASESSYEFGPTFVQAVVPKPAPLLVTERQQDVLRRGSDELLFGRLKSLTLATAVFEVRRSEVSVPVREVPSIHFNDRQRGSECPWLAGTYCRVRLQGLSLGPERVAFDELTGAITAVTADGIELTQACGQLCRIEWDMVRQIEPYFAGSSRLLGLGTRHLGNATRHDFTRPNTDGISWKLPLPSDFPAGELSLSLTVADLIPSGPRTLRGTPHLAAVREGFLATKLFINGRFAGSLNERTSAQNSIDDPARLVLPLDRTLLRATGNEIEFRQTPAQSNDALFDDCELSNIVLQARPPQ